MGCFAEMFRGRVEINIDGLLRNIDGSVRLLFQDGEIFGRK